MTIKDRMQKLVIILTIIFLFAGCKKDRDTPYQSKGVLLGPDMKMCPFCGGMMVKILTNDTTKTPPDYYRTNTNLASLGFTAPNSYPVNVLLNWHLVNMPVAGHFIVITKIKLDN